MIIYNIVYTENNITKEIECSELSLKLYIRTLNKDNNNRIISISETKTDNKTELFKYYNSKISYLYYRTKKYNIPKEKCVEYKKQLKLVISYSGNVETAKIFEETDIYKYIKNYDKMGDVIEKSSN